MLCLDLGYTVLFITDKDFKENKDNLTCSVVSVFSNLLTQIRTLRRIRTRITMVVQIVTGCYYLDKDFKENNDIRRTCLLSVY